MAKKYSYWLATGKFSLLQKITNIVLGLLTFMLLARLLAKGEFGVWGLFIIISSMVETTRFALIRNAYIVFKKTKPEKDIPATEFASLSVNITFSILLCIVFFFLGVYVEGWFKDAAGLSSILTFYAGALLLLIFYSQCEIFFYSQTNFKAVFWMYFLRNGSFALAVCILFFGFHDADIKTLALLYTVSIVPGCLVAAYFMSKYKKIVYKWDKKIFKEYFSFGKYVLGNNFFSLVFVNSDAFMTARSISAGVSTSYNIGSRILNFGDIPSQVFGDIMFPRAAEIVKTGATEDVKRIYEKTVAATLCFLIPFVLCGILLADVAVYILGGEGYLGAANIVRVMLLYSLFLPFIKQFGNIMDVKGRPHVNFWLMFCFAGISITSTYLCITWLGDIGAAVGLLMAYILLFAVSQYILYRFIGVSTIAVFKYIFTLYPEFFKLFKNFYAKKIAR